MHQIRVPTEKDDEVEVILAHELTILVSSLASTMLVAIPKKLTSVKQRPRERERPRWFWRGQKKLLKKITTGRFQPEF